MPCERVASVEVPSSHPWTRRYEYAERWGKFGNAIGQDADYFQWGRIVHRRSDFVQGIDDYHNRIGTGNVSSARRQNKLIELARKRCSSETLVLFDRVADVFPDAVISPHQVTSNSAEDNIPPPEIFAIEEEGC